MHATHVPTRRRILAASATLAAAAAVPAWGREGKGRSLAVLTRWNMRASLDEQDLVALAQGFVAPGWLARLMNADVLHTHGVFTFHSGLVMATLDEPHRPGGHADAELLERYPVLAQQLQAGEVALRRQAREAELLSELVAERGRLIFSLTTVSDAPAGVTGGPLRWLETRGGTASANVAVRDAMSWMGLPTGDLVRAGLA